MDLLNELKKLSKEDQELKLYYHSNISIGDTKKVLNPINALTSDVFFIYEQKEKGFFQELVLKDYDSFEINLLQSSKKIKREDLVLEEKESITIKRLIFLIELMKKEGSTKIIYTYRSGTIGNYDMGFELIDRLTKETINENGVIKEYYLVK